MTIPSTWNNEQAAVDQLMSYRRPDEPGEDPTVDTMVIDASINTDTGDVRYRPLESDIVDPLIQAGMGIFYNPNSRTYQITNLGSRILQSPFCFTEEYAVSYVEVNGPGWIEHIRRGVEEALRGEDLPLHRLTAHGMASAYDLSDQTYHITGVDGVGLNHPIVFSIDVLRRYLGDLDTLRDLAHRRADFEQYSRRYSPPAAREIREQDNS
jgi:hypothetical protein